MMNSNHKELNVDATVDNLPVVQAFLEERLEEMNCSMKAMMQIQVAVEEIYVNIAHYAYGEKSGEAVVRVEEQKDHAAVAITFIDRGVPYDPLAKEDPDVTLSAKERQVGGLGIFMTKKMMDDVSYERKDDQNVLTLKKYLG